MNCFSACSIFGRHALLAITAIFFAACGVSDSADRDDAGEYGVHYTLKPNPADSTVLVTLRVRQAQSLLRELSFPASAAITEISGDGQVLVDDRQVRWMLPARGGSVSWQATVYHERGEGEFDAYLGPEWGVFRMEDIIPRARTRTMKGARSATTIQFDLPASWSAISEYSAANEPIVVDRPARRFDEPAGWVAMGKLGVRRESIAGTHVAIAAPEGHSVRRMEMLAILNWTLPELNALLPEGMSRLTVVSAGEPMWRGGLSAPGSLYLHAERPLISENGTSALLHEVMHVALGLRAVRGYDWIVEGLAEYYSIELLRRGRAISEQRAESALAWQAEWSERADVLCDDISSGAETALAVTVFAALDSELRKRSEYSLDDVLPRIAGQDVDLDTLVSIVNELVGESPDALHIDKLPGCRSIR